MTDLPTADQRDWLFDFPPSRSLPLDQEALRVYERAYYIGLSTEKETDPPITFSTVALALLTGKDETSQWFAEVAQTLGPTLQNVRDEKGATDSALTTADPPAGRPPRPRLSSDNHLLTVSARGVLGTAEDWASRVGGSDIGVRHLVASYVLNPPAAHHKQMNDWGFNELAWRSRFFDWVADRYTAESWADASQKVAPTKAFAAFEQVKIKGASLAFPGDPQTIQVLNRAAEYHARLEDTWLRLQTVLFALVEQVRSDPNLRETIEPIWDAVRLIESSYRTAFEKYLSDTEGRRDIVPFDALDISPRVLNGLATARGLALTTRHENGRVGVLHLAAALLSRRVDGDEDWTAMGFDPQALRLGLVEHVLKRGEAGEPWREALGEEEAVTAGRPVDLNSDEPEAVVRSDAKWASDPLGIRPDVVSFAALLASKSLEPPLAIGLFGPWGSGKTTFLKRLRLAIDERAGQAKGVRDSFGQTPYVGNIVHVEFNAWHFAEDALVSSLVDTIVREIRSFIKDGNPLVGEALANLRSETAINSRRKMEDARAKEAAARKAVVDARKAVSESEAKAREGTAGLKQAVQAAWAAALGKVEHSEAVKESGVLENLGSAFGNLDEFRTRLEAVRSRPARMLSDLGWKWTALFAGAVFVVPAALAWCFSQVLRTGEVGQALASAGAMLSVVVIWLRAASGAVSKVDQAIAEITAAYEKQVRDDPKVKKAEKHLEAANVVAAEAALALAVAESELDKAEADATAVSLPAQMLTLVSGRVDDMTYAKELTTISAARADLQKLSTTAQVR